MTTNNNETHYAQLTTCAEQGISELMVRSTTLSKPQRDRHISMAHGYVDLWRRLTKDLFPVATEEFSDGVEADHRRLKGLIRHSSLAAGALVSPPLNADRMPPARYSYGAHWHRVQRSVRVMFGPTFGVRLADEQAADWHEFWEDAATMTFIHLHQLKDWFPTSINELANTYIDEHEPLQICADLANVAKHAWLDPNRGGSRAQFIARMAGPVINIPLNSSRATRISTSSVQVRVSIERDGVTTYRDAVELVRECFSLWRQFIAERIAAGELDDMEYASVYATKSGV